MISLVQRAVQVIVLMLPLPQLTLLRPLRSPADRSVLHLAETQTRVRSPEELSGQFEGDIILHHGSLLTMSRSVVNDWNRLWPGATVPFEIDPSISDKYDRMQLLEALELFRNLTCVQWVTRSERHTDYVVFVDGSGCSSWVGRQGGRQEVTLGRGCMAFVGTVLHEMMHAIGFWHEHSRWDRDRYINIVWQNIDPEQTGNFQRLTPLEAKLIGPYDYTSLMHYNGWAFSNNGRPTIEALAGAPYADLMGQRDAFSAVDLYRIASLYNCPPNPTGPLNQVLIGPPVANPERVEMWLPISANFEKDFNGFYEPLSEQTVGWERFMGPSGSTETGTTVDHTTGTARGIYVYLRSSPPAAAGDAAVLLSPKFVASGALCVRFWRHMFGVGVGRLSLLVLRLNGTARRTRRQLFARLSVSVGASTFSRLLSFGSLCQTAVAVAVGCWFVCPATVGLAVTAISYCAPLFATGGTLVAKYVFASVIARRSRDAR